MKAVKEMRTVIDQSLNYTGITSLDGVYDGCLNWINQESNQLEKDIKALRGFCKDDVSVILLEEFEHHVNDVRKAIDQGVTGVLNSNPATNGAQDYTSYIAEMFRRIQLLVPHLSTLNRMRTQLDAACA